MLDSEGGRWGPPRPVSLCSSRRGHQLLQAEGPNNACVEQWKRGIHVRGQTVGDVRLCDQGIMASITLHNPHAHHMSTRVLRLC